MTPEQLNTLRFIAYFKTITISDLALNQRITYSGAQYRLRRYKRSGLVRAQRDTSVQVRPGHGSAPLIWSLTKKGREKLAYFAEHIEYLVHTID